MSKLVLLVTNMPTPYRIPLFNELHTKLLSKGIRFVVIFGVKTEERRNWDIDMSSCLFEYEILNAKGTKRRGAETISLHYSGLIRLVKHYKPGVVIVPGFSIATLKLFFLNLVFGFKYIIWSGELPPTDKIKSYNKKFIKKILVGRASRYIAYGTLAKNYLKSLRIADDKIDVAINTVDTHFFTTKTNELRRARNYKILNKFIYIGNLTLGKRVDLILNAVSELKTERSDFSLEIIGEGPEKENLLKMSKALGIENHVTFTGFVQKVDLPDYLYDSLCMLFPSEYDIWGLVLCEAMAAGLPCISSVRAGATHDLIRDGENGYCIDFEDSRLVAKKMYEFLEDEAMARRMGEDAQKFMQENAGISNAVEGMFGSVMKVI